MKVDVSMSDEKEFHVSSWWAKTPGYVVVALRQQLEAAAAVWPELKNYSLRETKTPAKARGGAKGGQARAEALSPERRSEIAAAAANARWGTNQ